MPDGASYQAQLESVARQTGRRPPALDPPPPPPGTEHVWAWFQALNAGRGSNGFGSNPIAWADIAAWVSLTGTLIRAAEIEALFALDRVWLRVAASEIASQQKRT
jgi:hypothetical protein